MSSLKWKIIIIYLLISFFDSSLFLAPEMRNVVPSLRNVVPSLHYLIKRWQKSENWIPIFWILPAKKLNRKGDGNFRWKYLWKSILKGENGKRMREEDVFLLGKLLLWELVIHKFIFFHLSLWILNILRKIKNSNFFVLIFGGR